MPSRSVVSLTVSRNVFASAGVTAAGDDDAELPRAAGGERTRDGEEPALDRHDLDYRTHAHRHRSGRHEDRRHRDRRRRERAAAAADPGAARRLRQHARRRGRPRARHRSASSASRRRSASASRAPSRTATGRVKNANSTWLNGTPLPDDLSRMLDRPIRLANDANCFALSEATDGAGAGAGDRLRRHHRHGHRRRRRRRRARAHRRQRRGGRVGAQPAAGAARRRIAGAAVLLRAQRVHRDVPVGAGTGARLRRQRRRRASPRRRSRRARPAARRWRWRRSNDTRSGWRARSAASSTCSTRDVVVLGGGLSNIDRLYDRVPQLWAPYVFSDTRHDAPGARRARRFERRPRRGVVVGTTTGSGLEFEAGSVLPTRVRSVRA